METHSSSRSPAGSGQREGRRCRPRATVHLQGTRGQTRGHGCPSRPTVPRPQPLPTGQCLTDLQLSRGGSSSRPLAFCPGRARQIEEAAAALPQQRSGGTDRTWTCTAPGPQEDRCLWLVAWGSQAKGQRPRPAIVLAGPQLSSTQWPLAQQPQCSQLLLALSSSGSW